MRGTRFIFLAVLALTLAGCTENSRARRFGGESVMKTAPGEKVLVLAWKENSLWVLTRPMRQDECPETLTFRESAAWGVLEGTVTVVEEAPSYEWKQRCDRRWADERKAPEDTIQPVVPDSL